MIYKFKPINEWLFESLINSTIYVPSVTELNDPYDCLIDVDYLFEKAIDYSLKTNENEIANILKDDNFKKKFKLETSNVGVYSTSIDESILQEHLMWSHYSGNHTGICIKYSDTFIEYINNNVKKNHTMLFDGGVSYKENLEEKISQLPRKNPYLLEGLINIYLRSKSKTGNMKKKVDSYFQTRLF